MSNKRTERSAVSEKVDAMRRTQRAKERRIRMISVSLVVLVVASIAAAVAFFYVGAQSDQEAFLKKVKTYEETRQHVEGAVTYPQTPPAGGDHNSVWLNCGIYSQPVPSENAVHDMEHGAVWITYRVDLPAADRASLVKYAKGQTYLTVSPFSGLPAPVVASAWGKQITLTGVDDPDLKRFVRAFKQGPQTPEPGAPCSGGTGTPDE